MRATARGVYAHFGAVLLDILLAAGPRRATEILALVDVEGASTCERALARGRGACWS